MIVVAVDWDTTLRELRARESAIRRYRAGAAFLRATASSIEAGCDERPCAEASLYRRLAARAAAAAWLEEHNPVTPA